jgi:flagellar and swarming motility FlbT protein
MLALKPELRPNDRFILGNCVAGKADKRTRLLIDDVVAILGDKDIRALSRGDDAAKFIYVAQCKALY